MKQSEGADPAFWTCVANATVGDIMEALRRWLGFNLIVAAFGVTVVAAAHFLGSAAGVSQQSASRVVRIAPEWVWVALFVSFLFWFFSGRRFPTCTLKQAIALFVGIALLGAASTYLAKYLGFWSPLLLMGVIYLIGDCLSEIAERGRARISVNLSAKNSDA